MDLRLCVTSSQTRRLPRALGGVRAPDNLAPRSNAIGGVVATDHDPRGALRPKQIDHRESRRGRRRPRRRGVSQRCRTPRSRARRAQARRSNRSAICSRRPDVPGSAHFDLLDPARARAASGSRRCALAVDSERAPIIPRAPHGGGRAGSRGDRGCRRTVRRQRSIGSVPRFSPRVRRHSGARPSPPMSA